MATKIEKTKARLHESIEEGNYYQAHQQLRTITARYVKQENYPAAIDILYSGAQALLKAGQGGSGGDLCLFLLEVYKQGDLKSNADSKAKLLQLIGAMSSEEPTRKKVVNETITWSSTHSDYPAGDPELHHFIGSLYAQEDEPYEAERHLLLGTKDSYSTLSNLLYTWYTQDEAHTAPTYAARAVFGYLLLGNIRDATRSLDTFSSRLVEGNGGGQLSVQNIETSALDARIYPTLPLMNFLRLMCFAVQKGQGGADLWKTLRGHYAPLIKELDGAWDESMDQIGEMYFGVQINRPRNFMADMMGSLFGGAGGGGAAAPSAPKRPAVEPAKQQPPTVDLD